MTMLYGITRSDGYSTGEVIAAFRTPEARDERIRLIQAEWERLWAEDRERWDGKVTVDGRELQPYIDGGLNRHDPNCPDYYGLCYSMRYEPADFPLED